MIPTKTHTENLAEVERIRKEDFIYIRVSPINYANDRTVFAWEIEFQNGSSIYFGYKGEKHEHLYYEDAMQAALDFYRKL